MFVFVYSSHHLKLPFPHLVVILTTLEKPKNIPCENFYEISPRSHRDLGENRGEIVAHFWPPRFPHLAAMYLSAVAKCQQFKLILGHNE